MKKPLLSLLIFFTLTNHVKSQSAWAIEAGGIRSESSGSVVCDSLHNFIYAVGFFTSDSISFGSQTLINNGTGVKHDIYIVKYDFYGNLIWAKSAGSTGDDRAISASIDSHGNILVGGQFTSDTLTFDTIRLINAGTTEDLFLVKYDPSGNVIWAKSTGGSGLEYLMSMTTDIYGNTYMTGYLINSILVFGSDTISSVLLSAMYTLKYDSSGNQKWVKGIIGAIGNGITNDNLGNIFLTGNFSADSIFMDTIKLYNTGMADMFIAKYDSMGNCLWAKSAAGFYSDEGISIASNGTNRIFVAGNFRSPTLQFDTITLTNTSAASDDIFLLRLDENGNTLNANQAGSTMDDGATCVSVDNNGNVFLSGFFTGPSISFGPYTIQNQSPPGTYDAFRVDYLWNGSLYAESIGGTGGDIVKSICTSGRGDIFMTGWSTSSTVYIGQLPLSIPSGNQDDVFISGYGIGISTGEVVRSVSNTLYPNPIAAGKNSFIIIADNIKSNSVSAYDATGKKVAIRLQNIDTKNTIITFDVAPGIYFITVTTEKDRSVFKVIKE